MERRKNKERREIGEERREEREERRWARSMVEVKGSGFRVRVKG